MDYQDEFYKTKFLNSRNPQMAKKLESVFISKKRDGIELEYRFNYLSSTELTSVEKIRIQEWCRKQVVNQLQAFKMTFPEVD
jgi:hypothetical protein